MQIKDLLILIPCRKGSKGIKNKNILKIKNKMLYEFSLDHARIVQKKYSSSIIAITSNYSKILNKKYKNIFLIKRPNKISKDRSKSSEYVAHALNHFNKKSIKFKSIMVLQPTCPIRTKKDLLNSVKLFKSKKEKSLITAYEETYINKKVLYLKKKSYGYPLSTLHNLGSQRQENRSCYVRNGSIYITEEKFFTNFKKIISKKPIIYVMSKLNSINIDTKNDLEILKKII
tara:strand:+ start:162 stop:851 length:690 start_codon:yes stop_codon:yes gene_type:complete